MQTNTRNLLENDQKEAPEREFQKSLGLFDATMLVIGSMIGSGIFIVSADISRMLGSPGLLLLIWIITGVLTVFAALSYGELAAMYPKAGGQYVYLREAWGKLLGFLYGWTSFTVIQTGTIAAVGVAFAKFTSVLFPFLGEQNVLISFGNISISAAQILGIASIWLLTFVNTLGVQEGKRVQNVLTVLKALALFFVIILGLILGRNTEAIQLNSAIFWNASRAVMENGKLIMNEPLAGIGLLSAFGAAMVGSLFSSDAWNNVTFTAGEIKQPERNVPKSLVFGVGIVTFLYVLANVSYLQVLPLIGTPEAAEPFWRGIQFAQSDRVGTALVSSFLGENAAFVMAIIIMISTFGCNNGIILSGARLYYAMAKDGLFFAKAGVLNSKNVPAFALIIQAMWASVLCLSGSYGNLLDYVVFAVLIFYVITVLGLFRLRITQPTLDRPYKVWGFPFVPAVYCVIATAIVVNLLLVKPDFTLPGLVIVVSGIPVYFLWNKKK